jgi:hypothetical protein
LPAQHCSGGRVYSDKQFSHARLARFAKTRTFQPEFNNSLLAKADAMKSLLPPGALWAFLAGALLLLPSNSFAALGDNAASVLNDKARMHGALHSIDHQAYVLHEITASSGAKVREFVTPSGVVFGVAWEGQFPPDLQQLLGPYYQQAQQAAEQQKAAQQEAGQPPRRRGPAIVDTPGLVFVQSGHPRSFHGQAYIPQLVPQNVNAADIR